MLLPFDSDNRQMRPEAERFIQSALDALSAHIAILDDSGEIIGINAAWQKFASGNSFEEPDYGIGLNYLAVCDQSARLNSPDAPLVAQGIRDIIAGHITEFELEYPCHSPTEKRWFVVRISRFHWEDDLRVIVAHQNVSELKNTQIELHESQKRIQAVLDNIANAVFTVAPNGRIETCNPAAARVFGYALEEFVGMPITHLMTKPFNSRGTFRLLNGEHGHEIIGRRCDKSLFPMYFALNRMKLDDGTLYTVIIQDMTELKRMEAEIIEKEKISVALQKERELRDLKNRFLSMMSHELRTPLASIRLSHDMLKQYGDRATDEEKIQYLDNIQVQVEHLNEMVSDVMTLSKSERTEQGFNPERTDLITYCRDIVEGFQINHYQTHNIKFDCPDRTLTAEFDKKLLRRALTNLIGNAIKYSPDGGTVAFKLWREGAIAYIQVSDSGIGIPEQDAEYLFDAFHRASNVNNLPGTGLGLAIAKQTIDMHDGEISFVSASGKGTTFTIQLPLVVTATARV